MFLTRMSWTQTVIAFLLKLASYPTILDQCLKKFLITRKQTSKSFTEHCHMFLGMLLCSMMIKTTLIVSNWEDLFWAVVNDFVPKKKISGKQVSLWTDAEVKALCCKKDKMSRKALKEKDQVYIDKFKSLRKSVKKFCLLYTSPSPRDA